MKSFSKSIIAFAVISLSVAGYAFAAAGSVESKVAGCCSKASADGKVCAHPCCVEAAKAGDNCTKCKGSGKIVKAQGKK